MVCCGGLPGLQSAGQKQRYCQHRSLQFMLDDAALDTLFRNARSQNTWTDRPVPDQTLQRLYDLFRMGPTSGNCLPGRFVFLTTEAAKQRIAPALSSGNRAKSLAAPVITIIAHDLRFAEFLPQTFPHDPTAPSWFKDPKVAETTAFRNGTLQAAYMMLAARALGLDCGPMSGFDNAKVDEEFFPDGRWKSNFICTLGHGDPAGLFPRSPRLSFDQACRIL